MKIVIDYDPNKNVFSVQFDRVLYSKDNGDPWPPPPPYDGQVAEMAAWLTESYPSVTKKMTDQEISGLRMEFVPTSKG